MFEQTHANGVFGELRMAFFDGGVAEPTLRALEPPVGQVGGEESFAAEQGADLPGFGTSIGSAEEIELVGLVEATSLGLERGLGIRRGEGRCFGFPTLPILRVVVFAAAAGARNSCRPTASFRCGPQRRRGLRRQNMRRTCLAPRHANRKLTVPQRASLMKLTALIAVFLQV